MKTEPVAWYAEKNDGEMVFATSKAEKGHLENKGLEAIPLYTHPTNLTDEDLDKLVKTAESLKHMEQYIVGLIDGFNHARAILRKAQEK